MSAKGPLVLETERLRIRDHRKGDFDRYYALFADPEVTAFISYGLRADRKAQKAAFSEITAQPAMADRGKYYLLAEDRASGDYIGECGFDIIRREAGGGLAEAGYYIARAKWGRGYATEILAALIDYCFLGLGLHKVMATCDCRNLGSARVMEKSGMVREGLLRRQRASGGIWVDECFYGILREDRFPEIAP